VANRYVGGRRANPFDVEFFSLLRNSEVTGLVMIDIMSTVRLDFQFRLLSRFQLMFVMQQSVNRTSDAADRPALYDSRVMSERFPSEVPRTERLRNPQNRACRCDQNITLIDT